MLTVVCFYFQEIAYGYVSNSGEKVTNDWLKQGTYEIGNLFNKKTVVFIISNIFFWL